MNRELILAQSGGYITARTCSLFGKLFLEKRPWKRFCTNILIRGKWIHSTDIDGNQVLGRNAVPQIPLQKKALQKKALDFCLENWSCVRRYSCHTDLSRFVLPISDPSELNFSQFVGFQNSPNLNKIEKVAETCELTEKSRSNAGRRNDFWDQKSSDFSGEIFLERFFWSSITARTTLFPLISCGVDSFSPN